MTPTNHGFATSANLVECRDCESMFNLDAQWYYDSLCPDCKAEQDGEETTWPACPVCGERYDPDAGSYSVAVPNLGARGGREQIRTCSTECANDIEDPWA